MDLTALKAELSVEHPVTGPYSPDPAEAAAQLNAPNRSRDRETMTGSQILNAIEEAEFLALTAEKQERVWNLLHLGTLDPFGREADLMVDVFGAGSNTIAALAILRVESISRAEELGLEQVRSGDVQRARAQ